MTQTQLSPDVREPPKGMSKSMQTMLDDMNSKELQTVTKYIAVREAQLRLKAVNRDLDFDPSKLSHLSVRYIDENANEHGGYHEAIVELDNETRLMLTWSIERWQKHGQQRTRHDWTIHTWSSSQDCHSRDSINGSIIETKNKAKQQWFCAMHFNDCFEFEYEYETYPPLTAWRQKQSQVKEKSNKTKNNGNGNKVKAEDSEAEPMDEDIEVGEKEEEKQEEESDVSKDHALILWLFEVFQVSRVDLLVECYEHYY